MAVARRQITWSIGTRLEDRVAFQAAVASFARRIEEQTPEEVYSARLSANPRYFLKRGTQQWVAWRQSVLRQVERDEGWMIKTDLTAFFDTIQHKLLLAEIVSLNVDRGVTETITGMLRTWSAVDGLGLPQGPNASRLLANLYMLPIDRAMLDAGWKYSRFLDDVRIVSPSRSSAIEAIRRFQNECRGRGLIVSSGKTELIHGEAARKDLADEADLARVGYLMMGQWEELARKRLKAILKQALRSDVQVDVRRIRFSLWRLTQLRESGTLNRVLARLDDLAPVASVVAAYLRPFITRKSVVRELETFLADPSRGQSHYLETWLFSAMLEHRGVLPAGWANQAAKRVKDRNQPVFLRSVAVVVMARGERATEVAWIKDQASKEHDPAMLRAYVVALFWVGALDKGLQRRLAGRDARLSRTIEYLQGRAAVPSLVDKNGSLPIR